MYYGSYYSLLNLLPLLAIFYLIVIPIWLIVLSRRVSRINRKLGEQSEGKRPVRETARASSSLEAVRSAVSTKEETPLRMREDLHKPSAPSRSFEEQVGMHWFQWLGIAALIFALIFFLKWAFDNGIIGPVGRTVIGYVLAAAAMVAGDLLRKRYGIWSLAFTGGGALAAYIVTWVGLHVYHLYPSTMALVIYTLTTVVTCLLAGHYGSIPLAVFAIGGGFVTPMLTGEGGSILGLLTYILIIDLGVLALGHVRQWRGLNAFAFLGTIAWEYYALQSAYFMGNIQRSEALMFLAAFGVIYLLIPVVYNILQQKKSDAGDILIIIGNALGHFWLLFQWLQQTPGLREQWDAPIALIFSALFLAMSAGVYEKNKKDTPLVLSCLSLTVLFASIAIPLQLGEVWVSLAWSLEAAFLLVIALQLRDTRIQRFAWPVMIAAYGWYFFTPNMTVGLVYLHSGFGVFLLWAALLVGIAYIALGRDDRDEQQLLPFALFGGIVLTLALLSHVANRYGSSLTFLERFCEAAAIIGGGYVVLWQAQKQWKSLRPGERKGFTALGIGVQIVTVSYMSYEYLHAIDQGYIFAASYNKWQVAQLGISILWAAYSILTLVVGFMKGWRPLRLFSMILLLIAVAKLTLFDLFSLGTGYRVLGFSVLGVLLVGASFLYQRNKEQLKHFFVSDSSHS